VSEVSDVIRQKLLIEKMATLSRKQGRHLLQQLKQGKEPGGIAWSEFKVVGRQQSGEFDAKTLQEIMRADAASLPSYSGVTMPDGGYRIIRVTRIIDTPSADPNLRSAIESGILQTYARADAQAQVELAKSAQKVVIRQEVLEKKE
jgi:peptidyl-prolyl cis-trans isomerase D